MDDTGRVLVGERVFVSGGQSGADLGALLGAAATGAAVCIRTFRGFKPIDRAGLPDGVPVEYLDIREDLELAEKLRARTYMNVAYAVATVVFIHQAVDVTRGSWLTVNECVRLEKPLLLVNLRARPTRATIALLRNFLAIHDQGPINLAGQRTAPEPLVASLVEAALT